MSKSDVTTIENLGGSGNIPKPNSESTATSAVIFSQYPELHICMGLNACKGHDRFGTNSCVGTGFCATTEQHTCQMLNNCRSQGGCGLYGSETEQNNPGNNNCGWQGNCAVPVQAERYSTQGENKGKSVWVLARRLFEQRMTRANRTVGASPYNCGPPEAWLAQSFGSYDSRGDSGDKSLAFDYYNPAKDAAEPGKVSRSNGCGTAENIGDAAEQKMSARMNKNEFKECVRQLPNPGLGLGLRSTHFKYILEYEPEVDWFEIISENFMDSGGRPKQVLRRIAERYPVVMHGVSLSVGSTDDLNFDYLKKLKKLADEINPLWISDHLCWTGVNNLNTHDLLPLPLTAESLRRVCRRITRIQDFLERPVIFENPSTYLTFKQSDIAESDFLRSMTEETGCGLLLDVNNVYVSAFNNDFDAVEYIENLPPDKIVQMHIAGHRHCGDYIIDTHDNYVANDVCKLFTLAWNLTGGTSVLLEWDSRIPSFAEYHLEVLKAKNFMSSGNNACESVNRTDYKKNAVSNPVDFLVPDILYEFNK